MKTVVFHLQAKTCEKDISKLKEEILSYNIRIEEKELSEVKEEKDGILAITDQFGCCICEGTQHRSYFL